MLLCNMVFVTAALALAVAAGYHAIPWEHTSQIVVVGKEDGRQIMGTGLTAVLAGFVLATAFIAAITRQRRADPDACDVIMFAGCGIMCGALAVLCAAYVVVGGLYAEAAVCAAGAACHAHAVAQYI